MGYDQRKILVASEESFNNQDAVTFDDMLPVLAADAGFVSGRSSDRALQPHLFESRAGYLLPRSNGSFTLRSHACGAQVDTASGVLAHNWDSQLLADGLGGGSLAEVGGVAGASATASSLPNRTGTGLRGGIIRVGVAGDGRAEGQAAVMGNPTTSLLTALPAAPNAGDAVRAAIMVYAAQTLGTSKRFLFEWTGTDESPTIQYAFTGCHLESLALEIAENAVPMWTRTYRYAYWREVEVVTPTDDSLEQCDAATTDGGSYILQTVGTATRPDNAERAAASIEIALNFGLTPLFGQVEGLPGCNIRGFARSKPPGEPAGTLRLVHPFDKDLLESYDKDGSDSDLFHFLATLSVGGGTPETEGRHLAIYCPRLYRIGPRLPPFDWNGELYQESLFGMRNGPDVTNALTKSFFRMGIS